MKKTLLIIHISLLLSVIAYGQSKEIVITIDDLPLVGSESYEQAVEVNNKLSKSLNQQKIPSVLFVTGSRLKFENENLQQGLQLLEAYDSTLAIIGNHTYSHSSYNKTLSSEYFQEILEVNQQLKSLRKIPIVYFRAPFNHTGNTMGKRDSLINFLTANNIKLTPFTVENADYIYDKVYNHYILIGDTTKATEVGQSYLQHLALSLDWFEKLSIKTFDRNIPQILLFHSNTLNAEFIDDIIHLLKKKEYTFTSLDKAMEDEVYKTDDGYIGKYGISWLYRWRKNMKLPNLMRGEPEPAKWVMEVYNSF